MATSSAEAYLRSTPFVQWQQQKMLLTLDQVETLARSKNLYFRPSEAINSDQYEVVGIDGHVLRRSSLAAIRYYIERY